MRFKIGFGVFSDGFLGLQNMCFCRFWLFKWGAAPGLWERTLGHFWLSFVTFWGALLASLGTLVADIGCLWASFGLSLADFGELWGSSWTLCGDILDI